MPLCTFQRDNKKLENNELVERQKGDGRPPNLKNTPLHNIIVNRDVY